MKTAVPASVSRSRMRALGEPGNGETAVGVCQSADSTLTEPPMEPPPPFWTGGCVFGGVFVQSLDERSGEEGLSAGLQRRQCRPSLPGSAFDGPGPWPVDVLDRCISPPSADGDSMRFPMAMTAASAMPSPVSSIG